MIYLIIKEQIYEGLNNSYFVVDQTEDLDKANDILQGYNLINKTNKNILHSIIKYESPLVLTKEVA
jgi:hypothetical protein|tara:strand:- start:32 stop:229 length:198 start_codon:yes stop_codon:yes gene_type:complete